MTSQRCHIERRIRRYDYLIVLDLDSPEGVAIDALGRNMYFTDSGLDIVAVADLDGQHHKVLHRTGLFNPRSIDIDAQKG